MENKYHGLNSNQIIENQKKYGGNILKNDEQKSLLKIIISQFKDSTIYLLLIAGFLSLLLKEYIEFIIILSVLLINTTIGTIQEYKAEKSLDALKKLSSPKCKVFRNGQLIIIDIEELTIDDIVFLEEGDVVPGDLILLESNVLKIDESLLTGESIPVLKSSIDFSLDKNNLLYASTIVVSGNGVGRVTSIGMNTEVGKIAGMLKEDKERTPLQIKLDKLSKILGIITIVLAISIFLIGVFLNFNSLEILIFSISLAVAAIPEGLIAIVTIVLSLGVKKMVKANAIVRKLNAVETLGEVEIVCSDKTGTITKNQLEVKQVFTFSSSSNMLSEAILYCNNVKNNLGDPIEISMMNYLKTTGFLGENNLHRIKEYPFNSERKMMSVLMEKHNKNILFSKGASEIILSKCKYVYLNNNIELLTNSLIEQINNKILEMENKAYRVLAFAFNEIDKEEDMIFLGVLGFIDPPRDRIGKSISLMNKAGIKVVMITGDHKNTAFQIAKEVGIASDISQCISGEELDLLLSDNKNLDDYCVFSRVNPSHKVKIVDYYKKKNKVVAMTGDGVNDAPALKKSDVGIAMGNGSEVCKSCGDIILVDNNFKTIENAVEEGRNIFINIKKAVLFLLSSNLGEVLICVMFLLFRLPLPLLSIHILWVNLISDSLPALSLGSDKKYDDIMNEKPRNKDETLFQKNGLFIILFYGILIFVLTSISFLVLPIRNLLDLGIKINIKNINYMLENKDILIKSRTYAFTTLGISQLFHMIGMSNIKGSIFKIFKNKNYVRIIAFIFGYCLQVLVTEVTFLVDIFKTAKLDINEWIWLTIISMFPLLFHQIIRKEYKTGL